MEKVRVGVVGAGMIGKRHLVAIADTAQATLVGIADPDPGARDLADARGVPWVESASALLERCAPEAVIVATPTASHEQPVLEALDAGAHVLVEKPIAATRTEADRIVERSARTGRHVLVGHHRRYYPVLERTASLVAHGIGRLVAVSGHWCALKPEAYYAPGWRRERAAGPVLTNLIHEVDTLRFVCGEIATVSAEIDAAVRGYEKEDTAAIVLRFTSGALGTFLLSDATPSPWTWEFATGENPGFPPAGRNTHCFVGTEASLEFPNLSLWRQRPGEAGWNHPIHPESVRAAMVDAYAAQCAHLCAVVRGRETPRIAAVDGARTLAATLAVFDAAEQGRRVEP